MAMNQEGTAIELGGSRGVGSGELGTGRLGDWALGTWGARQQGTHPGFTQLTSQVCSPLHLLHFFAHRFAFESGIRDFKFASMRMGSHGMLKYFTASKGAYTSVTGGSGQAAGASSSRVACSIKGKEKASVSLVVEKQVINLDSQQSQESDVVILSSEQAIAQEEESKKRKARSYELNKKFQSKWAALYSWAEEFVDEKGEVNVKCIICSAVEGRTKLLVNKADSLRKHSGKRKAQTVLFVGSRKVQVGEYYFEPDQVHVKNEKIYAARGIQSVAQQVTRTDVRERNRKPCQFVTVNHLMSEGRPISDYTSSVKLLTKLGLPDLPKKHWSLSAAWEIAEALARQVTKRLQEYICGSRYISVTCDEVTTVDNCSWISIHVYCVRQFARVPMLLRLLKIVDGCNAENLYKVILEAVKTVGSMSNQEVAEKVISFGADGAAVFQGSRTGVITRMQKGSCPYIMGFHCVAHRTQLAAGALSNLPIVYKVEDLCQALYTYFSNSPKQRLEFQRLAEELDTEGLAILRNVKTSWISVLGPMERILGEYKTLIVKMSIDAPTVTAARTNASLLLDLQTLLAIPCLLPLLHAVNCLIKFAQARNAYICDFVTAVKVCQTELYEMYVDSSTCFSSCHFTEFIHLVEDRSIVVNHEWLTYLENHDEFLSFRIEDNKYPCHVVDGLTGAKKPVGRQDFVDAILQVKNQCVSAAELIIAKLDTQFPNVELLNALGVVFPQYYMQENWEEQFAHHFDILKTAFCAAKSISIDGELQEMNSPLSALCLEMQRSLFKITMLSNAKKVLEEPILENPVTRLWRIIAGNGFLDEKLSEWVKLAELAIVTVIGSVEDERTFSSLAWLKSKIRNRLGPHLDCTVQPYAQNFYTLSSFPYAAAIAD